MKKDNRDWWLVDMADGSVACVLACSKPEAFDKMLADGYAGDEVLNVRPAGSGA